MTGITADKVKILRDTTGAGFAECRKALADASGDIEAAKDLLRVRGLGAADAKATRDVSSGVVCLLQNDKKAVMAKLHSETDFVAMNPQFTNLALELSTLFLNEGDASLSRDQLLQINMKSGETVGDSIRLAASSMGENIQLGDVAFMDLESDAILGAYVHKEYAPNVGKVGVAVKIRGGRSAEIKKFAEEVAMQVAAMRPLALRKEDLDPAVEERERAIHVSKANDSGKPANVIEKMVEGSMRKFYSTCVLLEQDFVIGEGSKGTVRENLAALSKSAGCELNIESYLFQTVG